ncbi:MAG: DUF87 domain-containing protein [SAR324 cluster bacterium]|nr:DUF87 domain-containing protein [SAR324 cluster bacterium]
MKSKNTTTYPINQAVKYLKDLPLLAFNSRSRGSTPGFNNEPVSASEQVTLSFLDASVNMLILGGTGSGKTTGVVQPALDRLIQRHCAGLVLDIKGKFSFMARDYPGRVMTLGCQENSLKMNLVGDLNPLEFMGLLKVMHGELAAQHKHWLNEGLQQAGLVYAFLQTSGVATLDNVEYLLSHPKIFVEQLTYWLREKPVIPAHLSRMIERACHNPFSITAMGQFKLQQATETWHSGQQYEWYVGDLCTLLAPFSQNSMLKAAFCSTTQGMSLSSLIYEQRKTLIFSGNSLVGEENVARALKALFMKMIRESSSDMRAKAGCGESFFTFLMIDEYQHFIHAPQENNLCVFPDDNRFFDTSREFGHINILATQSLESLYSQVPEASVRTIVSNCLNLIALTPLIDPRTLVYLQWLAGETSGNIVNECVSPMERGLGFVFKGNNFSGNKNSFVRIMTGSVPSHPWMGRYLTRHCAPSMPVTMKREEHVMMNPYYASLRNAEPIASVRTDIPF